MGCSRIYTTPDFFGDDFLLDDFYVENPAFSTTVDVVFKEYLFERLPHYFVSQDTYKDGQGEGLLQRYLSIFGDYLDAAVMAEIECYLNIIDASLTSSNYIGILSDGLGNPPDIFNNEEKYRNLLQYIASVYKIKGTLESYELFFSILGFDIILTEVPLPILDDPEKMYDAEPVLGDYDDTNIYDSDECQPCSEYDIAFIPVDGSFTGVSETMLARINESIKFNEPVNAKLRYLTMGIQIEDTLDITIAESATENVTP